MSKVKETLINRANETVVGERESTIWYLAAKEIGRLENKVAALEHSRKLCHEYAECVAGVCYLDGDNCPMQE